MKNADIKRNAEDAKIISLDLQQGTEINQKVEYYKSILKAYNDLSNSISGKIERIKSGYESVEIYEQDVKVVYEVSKLTIEKLEADNSLYEKKKFFEHWLGRSAEYEKKFALITKECEEKFVEVEAEARVYAEGNIKLKSYMTKYDAEQTPDQKMKNEYYLLLKYEVSKITGKGKMATA